jgi:plastocyanin
VCAALAAAASFVVLPAAPAHAGCDVTVDLPNFSPATLHVAAGATVTWCWASDSHSVTGTGLDSDVRDTGATFTHAFATAGTYAYHCKIHSTMQATVVVQAASPSPTHTTTPKPVPTTRPPAATTPPPAPTKPAATTPHATTPPATGAPATPAAPATHATTPPATTSPQSDLPAAASTTPLAADPKPGGGLPAVPLAIGAAVVFGDAVLFTLRRSGPAERTSG